MLDPDLTKDLQEIAANLISLSDRADTDKWAIAARVNDMWDEHKGQYEDKTEYYAECSRVANQGQNKKLFSDSGSTLRKWCEVQATYENFPEAEALLSETSFKHLEVAKSLAYSEKVQTPLHALDAAMKHEWTADEMKFHFDPPTPPNHYEIITGWLSSMLDREKWQWIKSADKRDEIIFYVNTINSLIRRELEKENKSPAQPSTTK